MGQNTLNALPPFAGGNLSETYLIDVMSTMANSADDTFNNTAGGSLTLGGTNYGTYEFGIFGPTTIASGYTPGDYSSTTASSTSTRRINLVAIKGDLTINSGVTFRPHKESKFTCYYVKGNIVNNGTMLYGGNYSDDRGGSNPTVAMPLKSGSTLATNACGNGGQGGTPSNPRANGGAGGMFAGGGGGGGRDGGYGNNPGTGYGGRGGNGGPGNAGASGGGGGNPGGTKYDGTGSADANNGDSGAGGCVIFFVEGTFTNNGTISSQGAKGGNAVSYSSPYVGAGGGSGGGAVIIHTTGGTGFSGNAPNVNGGARGVMTGYQSNSLRQGIAGNAGTSSTNRSM